MTNHLLCFGFGYVAEALAKELKKNGDWKFSGTKRSYFNHDDVKIYNYNDLTLLPRDVTHILISIPPKDEGDVVVNDLGKQIKLLPNLKWVGYLSATSVYGDTMGEWVDENSPINPGTAIAKRRVVAEEQWRSLDLPLNIFRLSGIYGPTRSAFDRISAGHKNIIDKPGQVFSRIHIADIVQVLMRSIESGVVREVYNLADDMPTSSRDIYEYAYDLMGEVPPKPVKPEDADLTEMGMSFYSECRRVKNDKIKNDLGVKLKYPSYKEGMKAIF
jgi:nucleoside-diphosphate-sugar epimerase